MPTHRRSRRRRSRYSNWNQHAGDKLSIAGTLPAGITASRLHPVNLDDHAQRRGVAAPTIRPRCARWSSSTNRAVHGRPRHPGRPSMTGRLISNIATTYMHVELRRRTSRRCSISTPTTRRRPARTISPPSRRGTRRRRRGYRRSDHRRRRRKSRIGNDHADQRRRRRHVWSSTGPAARHRRFGLRSGTGVLTLTGNASLADYQTALAANHVQQCRHAGDRNPRHRGDRQRRKPASNVAHAIIEIDPVTSPLLIDLDPNDSTAPGNNLSRDVHGKWRAGAIADTDTSITDLRQHRTRFRDDHADQPAVR